MQTFTELLTNYQDATNDNTSTNKTRALRRFNEADKRLCARKDFPWLRDDFPITTVANQQFYDLPVRLRRPSSVKFTVGGNVYTLAEITDPKHWEMLNNPSTYTSDYPLYYFIQDGQIGIYPKPSSSGNVGQVKGVKIPLPMKNDDYSTGTIAVTNGSAAVVGTTTVWATSTNARKGAFIFIDDQPYEILSITDNTHLTLVKLYQGETASGLSYKIGDCPTVLDGFQDLVWLDGAKYYLGIKKLDAKAYQVIKSEHEQLMQEFDRQANSLSTDQIIQPVGLRWNQDPNLKPISIGP